MVLPIWEGAGNIMVLDMLRASAKSRGLALMLQHVEDSLPKLPDSGAWLQELAELKGIAAGLFEQEQDTMETTALHFFGRLSRLYQLSLLQQYQQEGSQPWIAPTLDYFRQRGGQGSSWLSPPAEAVIHQLMGWEIG
jgi:acyl-CoA dehydrogenase